MRLGSFLLLFAPGCGGDPGQGGPPRAIDIDWTVLQEEASAQTCETADAHWVRIVLESSDGASTDPVQVECEAGGTRVDPEAGTWTIAAQLVRDPGDEVLDERRAVVGWRGGTCFTDNYYYDYDYDGFLYDAYCDDTPTLRFLAGPVFDPDRSTGGPNQFTCHCADGIRATWFCAEAEGCVSGKSAPGTLCDDACADSGGLASSSCEPTTDLCLGM